MADLEKINGDLQNALKNKDETRRAVLGMLKSDLENERIAKKRELKEEEMLEVLSRAVKSRKDSAAEFKKGGREELAQKEEAEIKIIQEYLPEQMPEEEVRKLAGEAVEKTGAAGPGDMGKVMGQLMPQLKGRADGALVSRVVQGLLKDKP